jgi:hypothetical protein
MTRMFGTLTLAIALAASAAFGQAAPPSADARLELFIRALHPPSGSPPGDAATTSQQRLEQVLRMLPPVAAGHGGAVPLVQGSQAAAAANQDPSIYGFCYQACRTERAAGSCGTPAPGSSAPPQAMCRSIEDTAALNAVIGPQFGTGASPFVDDNKSLDDSQQPAGYTFLGQFIDHDVTRTQTALLGLAELDRRAQSDQQVRAKLAAAGITPDRLQRAIANAAAPSSALSVNTGKLDLDSVYGVSDFAALSTVSAPWFEQRNGSYTGRFAQRHVQAPAALGAPIDGFDYLRLADGTPQVPDPRNSEHKLISQLQNLFELAHNDCMDHVLTATGTASQQQVAAAFDDCHKKVVWTYETIVATDFLPRFSAEASLDRVAPGSLHAYRRGTPHSSKLPPADGVHTFLYRCTPGLGGAAVIRIPHEFAVAAFRLGHTLVRNLYVLHDKALDANGQLLTGQDRPIFAAPGEPDATGLVGNNPLEAGDVIDWSYFFDTAGFDAKDETAQPGRPVDALISEKLFMLPVAALPPGPDANGKDTSTERNLPRRNIMRASEPTSRITGSVGLATGEEMEAYAQQRIMGLHDSTREVRQLLARRLEDGGFDPRLLRARTPLWLFVLAEAESTQSSQRLGELGSHIIDEFLLGSLSCDEASVLYASPDDLKGWGPTDAIARNRRYSMPELIAYLNDTARVDGQPIRLFSR